MKIEITDPQELLSAFVDEETTAFEVQRLCGELHNDRELARLGRCYVIGDAMRGNLPLKIDANFVASVRAAIEREPLEAVAPDAAGWRPRLLNPGRINPARINPAMGFGLAASIAVCAVIGFQSFNSSSTPEIPVTNVARINPAAAGSSAITPSLTDSQLLRQTRASIAAADAAPGLDAPGVGAPKASLVGNSEVAARLNSYLVNHSEYAPSRGMMPYARAVVGYEGDR